MSTRIFEILFVQEPCKRHNNAGTVLKYGKEGVCTAIED